VFVYLDTSALVKRYIEEVGSARIRSLLYEPATRVFTSQLTLVESTCAFARRRREGLVSVDEHRRVLEMLYYEFEHRYNIMGIEPPVIDAACQLATRNPLRAYDAVHLATAWLLHRDLLNGGHEPLTFVCADVRLLDIARDEGLVTENPNDHP
jgi:predicted nucleic acid-binding protein